MAEKQHGQEMNIDNLLSELTDSLKPQGELRPLCLIAAGVISGLRAGRDEAAEKLHYEQGVSQLAMKHRDEAEERVRQLEAHAKAGAGEAVEFQMALQDAEATISRLTAERDGARAAAIEEAAQVALEYHDEAWGNSAEQSAALSIANAIRALATPTVTDADAGGDQ